MHQNKESFWGQYLMQPTKHNPDSYAVIRYDVLEECELDIENLNAGDEFTESITYLSVPGETEYHHFGTMPSELTLIKNARIRSIKKSLWSPLGYGLLFVIMISLGVFSVDGDEYSSFSADWFFLFFLVLVPLFRALVRYIEVKKLGQGNVHQWLEYRLFKRWLDQRTFAQSWYLPALIGIFFAWQYGSWDSPIDLLGLTKPLSDFSMSYKLFTVVLVHANLLHLLSNLAALYFLSNLFMQFASYKRLLLVFFFSAITGSLFSILFLPNTTSVGASGAILGLLGFVLAASIRHRAFMPQQFTIELSGYVLLTAVLGLFIFEMIDNGAHLGGLLGGMVIGFLHSEKSLKSRLSMLYEEVLEKHKKRKAEARAESTSTEQTGINESAG